MWRGRVTRIVAGMNKKIAGLLLLGAVPFLSALARVGSLTTGSYTLEQHERFAADPWTALLHMIGATAFATVGAFQFVPSLRRGRWHRIVGRVLSALGIGAALAGMWMALTWPPKEFDSAALTALRAVVTVAMVSFVGLGVIAARRRDFDAHEAWMVRAYALFIGPGTQVFTIGFTALPFMQPYVSETIIVVGYAAGWGINALVAEWMIRGRSMTRSGPSEPVEDGPGARQRS